MKTWKVIGYVMSFLFVIIALEIGFGYVGVFKTKTVGKAQQDADRDVFESTNSFTKGKLQEAIKYRLEYMKSKDPLERNAIKMTVASGFVDFDEDKFCKSAELRDWIKKMKYDSPESIPIQLE